MTTTHIASVAADVAEPSPQPAGPPVAALTGVSVRFPRPGGGGLLTALDNVSLELREGELLVLVGRSGSGKTTALNVLAGLVEPAEGRASIGQQRPAEARRRLGYMFARDALLPWRTARENVEFGLELRGVSREQRREIAMEYLEIVRLESHASNYPGQLSQGQRQRVSLARTWALSPDVLLMDEPFSALDAETRDELQIEFLRHWQRDRRSVIFVTHDLNEALLLADRVLVFAAGRIAGEFQIPNRASFARPRDLLEITSDVEARATYRAIREIIARPDLAD
jgi:NitT/TauT family transport system ATP-binding protein